MKWLQWAAIDLKNGVGGVENHARCLARELRKLNVEVVLTTDPRELFNPEWDVIHTHGSNFSTWPWLKSKALQWYKSKNQNQVRVFTHHGLTHERMLACHEYFWPGGYRAMGREYLGAKFSDVILSVNQHTHDIVKNLAPVTKVCLNAWDTTEGVPSDISKDLELELKKRVPFILVLGRFYDNMKGYERIAPILKKIPELNFVACPGIGFETNQRVFKTGRQETSEQVLKILRLSSGLLSTSIWESGPIVVLEALGQGVPVICPAVGLVSSLSSEIKGLFVVSPPQTENFVNQIQKATMDLLSSEDKDKRAAINRMLLPSWADAARIALGAVKEFKSLPKY